MIREMRDRDPDDRSTEAPPANEAPHDRQPMAFMYRELLDRRVICFMLTTVGLIVSIVSFIGPIGSYESLSLPQRFVYCAVCAAFGLPVSHCLMAVTYYYMRRRTPAMSVLAASLAMLFVAVPCSAVASSFRTMFYDDVAVYDGFLKLYLVVASLAVTCCLLLHYVVCQRIRPSAGSAVTAGMSDAQRRVGGADAAPEGPGADEATAVDQLPAGEEEAHAPFFEILPTEIGREIVYIKTEDHYLDVHTTSGSARVPARFADAVHQLGELGMQVHRCYWVAHREMVELVTRDRRTLLRLADDRGEVPVSRRYLPDVKAALGAEPAAVGD